MYILFIHSINRLSEFLGAESLNIGLSRQTPLHNSRLHAARFNITKFNVPRHMATFVSVSLLTALLVVSIGVATPKIAHADSAIITRINKKPILTVKTPDSQWQTQEQKSQQKVPTQDAVSQKGKSQSTAQSSAKNSDQPLVQTKPKTKSQLKGHSKIQAQSQAGSKTQAKQTASNELKSAEAADIMSKKEVQVFVTQANKLLELKDIEGYASLIHDDALLTSVVNMLGESFSSVLTKPQYIEETKEGLESTSSYDYRVQINSITILPKLSESKNTGTQPKAEVIPATSQTASTNKPAHSLPIQAVVKSTVTEKVTIAGKRYASTAKESAVVERVDGKLLFTKIDAEVFLTPLTAL